MAAGDALPGRCPGGAAPGLAALGKRARAGLVTEAAGSDRKGEPPTAVRHAATACPGLNMAGGRGEPARRESRALAARAAATVAVRPPILSPTSRRHLDRIGPAANSKTLRREQSRRLRRHPPLCGIRRTPRRTDGEDASEDRWNSARPRAASATGGTGRGSLSLQIVAGIWQGGIFGRPDGRDRSHVPDSGAHALSAPRIVISWAVYPHRRPRGATVPDGVT